MELKYFLIQVVIRKTKNKNEGGNSINLCKLFIAINIYLMSNKITKTLLKHRARKNKKKDTIYECIDLHSCFIYNIMKVRWIVNHKERASVTINLSWCRHLYTNINILTYILQKFTSFFCFLTELYLIFYFFYQRNFEFS